MTSLLLVIVIVFMAIAFRICHSRQRQKIKALQDDLARNFHDEIGPMLLYASTLITKEEAANPTPGMEELRVQIRDIMNAVRGISHDLKEQQLSSVNDFSRDIAVLLEKLRSSTGVDHRIKVSGGEELLGPVQYVNLRKIIRELVTNSIKYAECRMLFIQLRATGRQLHLTYSDDGIGLASEHGGIGLKNIEERVALLNGKFHLQNNYPKGYFMEIVFPLSF